MLADLHHDEAVDERLGEPRSLARSIARDYRRRSWFGRRPLIAFVVLPVPLLLAAWGAAVSVAAACFFLNDCLVEAGWVAIDLSKVPPETAELTLGIARKLAVLELFFLTPTLIAWRYGRFALKRATSRWSLIGVCLLIGLANGLVSHQCDLDGNELTIGFQALLDASVTSWVQHYLEPMQLAQLAAPLLAGGALLLQEERRRAALLAA